MKKILTLCIILKDGKVLLGMKKRGFGEGRWNGFGGKLEEGESIEESAKREIMEEVGIVPIKMSKSGILEFIFENDSKVMEVHVFKVNDFMGEPKETEEMKPEWFEFEKIPFSQMWPDDQYWFPYILNGKLFKGSFLFDKPSTSEYTSKIIEEKLEEVSVV